MGQQLNELQAFSIRRTCDHSRSCSPGAAFQNRDGKLSVRSKGFKETHGDKKEVKMILWFLFTVTRLMKVLFVSNTFR